VFLRTHKRPFPPRRKQKAMLALAATALATLPIAAAHAFDGGTGTPGSDARTGKARLVHGKAIPPSNAPSRVVGVIDAANRIAKGEEYCYGGGHSRFKSRCYDCSGAVSYALHGGHFLRRPLDSSGLMHWGRRGKGRWIKVFSNPGHAYMVVAGLRFDTSMTKGRGPGWSKERRSGADYRKRHKGRY